MRRTPSSRGARAVAGRNHEGRKVHKSYLGPTEKAFNPGTTRVRTTGAALAAVGAARVSCWCDLHYVEISLDDVHAGRTASCGTTRCNALAERVARRPVGGVGMRARHWGLSPASNALSCVHPGCNESVPFSQQLCPEHLRTLRRRRNGDDTSTGRFKPNLDESAIADIRARARRFENPRSIAASYGVSTQTVRRVLQSKRAAS